jgi:hypothetical protein
MNELTIKKELTGLDESKARQIEAVFAPMVEMLKGFEAEYENVMAFEQSPEKCAKAKRLRLDISRVRIEADKVRKEQKDEYLRAGNAIQGVYNILKFAVTDKEEKLKDVEQYYELIEKARIDELQASRSAYLLKYNVDGSTISLGTMEDQIWLNFLAGTKANYEAVLLAERKAEEELMEAERLRKEEEERIRKENEELKAEQIKAEKERQAREEQLKKEREAVEKERLEREAAIVKERQAREELERKIEREKAEEIRKTELAKAEEEARKKAEEEASDKHKLNVLAGKILNYAAMLTETENKDFVFEISKQVTNRANSLK